MIPISCDAVPSFVLGVIGFAAGMLFYHYVFGWAVVPKPPKEEEGFY